MASIEKRVGQDGSTSYRAKVRVKGFAPETATFARRTDARLWAAKVESDIKLGRHFGVSSRHSFADLVKEYKPHARDGTRLAYWEEVFGTERLDAITPARIAAEREA